MKSEGVIREFGNVMVIGKADLVTYKGPTMIASTLHAVAILLKEAKDWDWFVNLSASDYPLMSQDGKKHFYYNPTWIMDTLDSSGASVNGLAMRGIERYEMGVKDSSIFKFIIIRI